MIKIIGMRKEIFIDYNDREEENYQNIKWIFYGINSSDKQKVQITIWETEGDCYSGYCGASWGNIEIVDINDFGGYTHKPIKEINIPDDLGETTNSWDEKVIENEIFEVDYDGGDGYYPSGYVKVNEDLFIETARAKDKRPVWIFRGDSNSGKSYISHLTDKEVYETDSNEELPSVIVEDIVVVGNKYDFKTSDIIGRLFGDVEVIFVDFSISK